MAKIPFLEVFGPTIQGEGMVIGKRLCSFVLMVVTMVAFGVIQLTRGTVAKR